MTRFTPQWLQAGSYAASQDRRLIGALWPAPASAGCAVTASAGMVVNVAAGQVAVPSQNNTGSTLCSSDAVEAVTVPAAPGSGTNRIDLIVCQPRGNDLDGGANTDFIFTSVQGVAVASPVAPATPAGTVALAQILITGGSAAIAGANITDVRPGGLAVPIGQPATAPRGYVAGVFGPASAFNAASGTVLTLAIPVTAGRRYRVDAYNLATQQSASGNAVCTMTDSGGYFNGNLWRLWQVTGLVANNNGGGGSARTFAATASGTVTVTMAASTSAGTLSIGANWCWITAEDIGT